MRPLILFAHPEEAQPTIERCSHLADVVVTGVGMLGAALATMLHGPRADEIWNLGLAGALSNRVSTDTLHEIGSLARYVHAPPFSEEALPLFESTIPPSSLPGSMRLVTVDFPLHDAKLRDQLAEKHDLVDMEGYGIARAAEMLSKPVRIWKVVSDDANSKSSAEIKERLPDLANRLADHVARLLSDL